MFRNIYNFYTGDFDPSNPGIWIVPETDYTISDVDE